MRLKIIRIQSAYENDDLYVCKLFLSSYITGISRGSFSQYKAIKKKELCAIKCNVSIKDSIPEVLERAEALTKKENLFPPYVCDIISMCPLFFHHLL